jgi:hypothetical protein
VRTSDFWSLWILGKKRVKMTYFGVKMGVFCGFLGVFYIFPNTFHGKFFYKKYRKKNIKKFLSNLQKIRKTLEKGEYHVR